MADMLSRNAGNTEGAPAWIRVAQDGEGMHGGFWTCAAATENSPQYIRADLVRKALEPQAVDDAMVERVIDAVMGADTRQQSMGLAYIEAERQDFVKEITNFIKSHIKRVIEGRISELVQEYGSWELDTNVTNLPEWVETVTEELETILKTLAPELPKR